MCGGGIGGYAVLTRSINPQPIIKTETLDNTILTATVNVEAKTYAPNTDGSIGPKPTTEILPIITQNTSATISASETRTVTTLSENNTEIVSDVLFTETKSFDTRQTRSQIQVSVENKLRLIQQYLNRFYVLLNGWIID
jgi:(p)ppGpp synthase/HD superfamily hydrolase